MGEGVAYVAVGGYQFEERGGVHGIDVETGERLWFTPPQALLCEAGPGCSASQSAAVTAIPGAVFSGSADGGMRCWGRGFNGELGNGSKAEDMPFAVTVVGLGMKATAISPWSRVSTKLVA